MNRTKLNYFIDIPLGISFIITTITSVIIFLIRKGADLRDVSIFFNRIGLPLIPLHERAGIIMILLTLLHFALHWKWLVKTTELIFQKQR